MYDIEATEYGYEVTFSASIDDDDLREWELESTSELEDAADAFGVVFDARELGDFSEALLDPFRDGQDAYRRAGMERSALILDSAVVALKLRRLAKDSGVYEWERYVHTGTTDDWRRVAADWVDDGLDPEYR